MKKSKKETMRMTIETADNGIVIRNPEEPDDVHLAVAKATKNDGFGYTFDHSEEHRAIGRRIYYWLMEELSEEYEHEMVITGFDIEINAWVTGPIPHYQSQRLVMEFKDFMKCDEKEKQERIEKAHSIAYGKYKTKKSKLIDMLKILFPLPQESLPSYDTFISEFGDKIIRQSHYYEVLKEYIEDQNSPKIDKDGGSLE